MSAHRHSHLDREMLGVVGDAGTFSLAREGELLGGDDLDLHVQRKGEREDVEAGTEVGR